MNITILGGGSWGSALAATIAKKNYPIKIWGRGDFAQNFNATHKNERYLPGIEMPENIIATSSLGNAITSAEVLIIALPSKCLREVLHLAKPHIKKEPLIIQAGKGLESSSGMRGSEVIRDVLGGDIASKLVVLSGPNLAMEIANGEPTATVLASKCEECATKAQNVISSDILRAYRSCDVVGVELGGAIKNILAIGAGLCDGLGYGDNTKASLVTRGIVEMKRLSVVEGADGRTFMGLSGIGDLIATCSSKFSRNLTLGRMLGSGKTLDESLRELNQVAEGVATCNATYNLSQRYNISMPITWEIYRVLFEGKSPTEAVKTLMSRNLKTEITE